MRALPLAAIVLGFVVIIWEIPFIFTRTGLWPVLMVLALAVILLAISQLSHGS